MDSSEREQGDQSAVPFDVDGLPVTDVTEVFNETFFLTLGFSFMVGLAIGFLLKIAFKIALIGVGLILLATFLLQSIGILQVDWTGLEVRYDGWVDWLGAYTGRLFGFMGDHLPSAASFSIGVIVGLKL